ncbi:glycosyltransferase family 2 protein [Echinicola rosea]|uniref:Glycosyl transferase n=1 Tax=Echinicola rosea TaxID=1807691 RepID=A0ABQ1V6F9_9BACT|nr:glycosyltransferase family A protein [Echinicola rosea]GGF38019.1 glycosyl transferase [Echinicola rosea]
MFKNKLISIIIPSYNYGRFLPQTISNLKEQSYPNWEAIIIDDGSTDNTEEVALRSIAGDERFKYERIKNKGNAGARNIGLDLAKGDYIQFLDADDFLSQRKLEFQLKELNHKKENVISYTNNVYFKDGKPDNHYPDFNMQGFEWIPKISGQGHKVLNTLMNNNFAVISSPLISHVFLKENKIKFPENLGSKVDWIFWIECVLSGASLEYLDNPEAITLIRRHDQSITVKSNVSKFGEIHARTLIHEKLVKAKLGKEERQALVNENNLRKTLLLKNHFYHSSLSSFETLASLFKNTDIITFTKYFFKGLNFKRKQHSKRIPLD